MHYVLIFLVLTNGTVFQMQITPAYKTLTDCQAAAEALHQKLPGFLGAQCRPIVEEET